MTNENDFSAFMRSVQCGMAQGTVQADDRVHRYQIEGDKPRRMNGAYRLRIDPDGFAVGWCKDWRQGETHVYTSKTKRGWSAEEKAEYSRRRKAEEAERAEREAREQAEARVKAKRIWDGADKRGESEYLRRKQVPASPCRFGRNGTLIVPVYHGADLVSLQFIMADGEKRFMRGALPKGFYCTIKGETDDVIIVGEGWATVAACVASTGYRGVIAFNTGNLCDAVELTVAKFPKSRIIIAADHDQLEPDEKKPNKILNPGEHYAAQAAVRNGGLQVIMPEVVGDWSDYYLEHGKDAVRDKFHSLPEVSMPEPMPDTWEPVYEPEPEQPKPDTDPLSMLKDHIRPQGYTNDGKYAFFPRATGQIVYLSPTQLGKIENLYHLAPLSFWTASTGLTKPSEITAMVTPQLMSICQMRGVFDADAVRGVGAWRERNGVVINCGDQLYVCSTGEFIHPNEFKGDGVYVTGPRVFSLDCDQLRNKEAYRLRELCDMLTWRRGMNGTILAGWLVVAAVGGCLSWRPSIWVTGPKGSGKSTVVDDIINGLLRGVVLRMDGGSTEAGLRNMVGESSRPVLMDEAESEAGNAANMEKILFWVRRAASGGVVVNYNGVSRAQSCVCLSGINPALSQGADKDRITLLELEVNTAPDANEHYERVLDLIAQTITPEFSKRLMRRVVDNIDTLLANIEVFVKCAARVLGSKRAGDQIGPMLAGAYLLGSTGRVTPAKAEEWIAKQDWTWFEEDRDSDDATRLMQRILTAQVRHTSFDRTSDVPVLDLVQRVAGVHDGWQDAEKTLGRYGLAYESGRLLVANNSDRLSDLLKDTVWRVYKPTLSRYNGCTAGAQAMYFKGGGGNHRYMAISLEGLV